MSLYQEKRVWSLLLIRIFLDIPTKFTDFQFKNRNKLTVKTFLSRTSFNLIYDIICAGCSENHIERTEDTLRNRMRVNRQQIIEPKYQCIFISKHIENCGNCGENKNPMFTVLAEPWKVFFLHTGHSDRQVCQIYFPN